MADDPKPYIEHSPGDLITAEDWNGVQVSVQKDIAKKIDAAIKGKTDIEHATNSDKIGGKSIDELTKSILALVFAQLPKRTGYMQFFCNLQLDTDVIIPHNLRSYPLVDVYQLDYFPVVCAKSETDARAEWVQFYLYHSSEKRLRLPPSTPPNNTPIEIETKPTFRIRWELLLGQLAKQEKEPLDFNDDTTLGDLGTEFWQKLLRTPQGEFDPDSYCHSPWFEKCCGEKRTVGDLKKRDDFNELYLKIQPQKTINFPYERGDVTAVAGPGGGSQGVSQVAYNLKVVGSLGTEVTPEPTNIRVSQLDQDHIAVRLLKKPVYPGWLGSTTVGPGFGLPMLPLPPEYADRLQVMLLCKV